MYGFPLTIFLLSGWLQTRAPGVDLMSHDAGHLWSTIFGLKGNPHIGALHLLSGIFLVAGFWILGAAWPVLYRAQRAHQLATQGVYARVRHPQYVGFVLIMLGFLLQWPTLLTLAMFPVLVFMYLRLAISEEKESAEEFGQAWRDYAAETPRFIPRLSGSARHPISHGRA
jgi:protein-S-isoprenylcysteine O-methyltransferase Ste14